MLVSLNVMADWTYLTTSDGGYEYYVDYSTRKINGSFRSIWRKTIFDTPSKYGDLSTKSLEEFDCKNDAYRIISVTFYTDKESKNIDNTLKGDPTWEPIIPDSVYGTVLKFICNKK